MITLRLQSLAGTGSRDPAIGTGGPAAGSLTAAAQSDVRWRTWVALPGAWVVGLLCTGPLRFVLGETNAFVASLSAVLIAIVFLWMFFLRRLDRSLSTRFLWLILAVYLAKAFYAYYYWTTCVMEPRGGSLIQEVFRAYSGEYRAQWEALWSVHRYWERNGFAFFVPRDKINIHYPIAFFLMSLSYHAFPRYPEILFTWQAFYPLIAAGAVFAIARLERYSPTICRQAFLIALLAPFSWFIALPFRDFLLQMFMGCVLYAALLSARRGLLPSLAVAVFGAWLVSCFRTAYAVIVVLTVAYSVVAYRNERTGTAGTQTVLCLVALGLLALAFVAVPGIWNEYFFSPMNKYVGYEAFVERGYQRLAFQAGPWRILAWPYRLLYGLVTPIPWKLEGFGLEAAGTYSQQILGGAIFGLSVYGLIRDLWARRLPPVPVVFSFLFILAGIGGVAIHPGYVQVSMIFLLPFALRHAKSRFPAWLAVTLVIFVFGNLLWMAIRG